MTPPQTPEWTLGDRLRKAMKTAGLSQRDMATALNLHPSTISGYLTDTYQPPTWVLQAWATTTAVPLAFLLPETAAL